MNDATFNLAVETGFPIHHAAQLLLSHEYFAHLSQILWQKIRAETGFPIQHPTLLMV